VILSRQCFIAIDKTATEYWLFFVQLFNGGLLSLCDWQTSFRQNAVGHNANRQNAFPRDGIGKTPHCWFYRPFQEFSYQLLGVKIRGSFTLRFQMGVVENALVIVLVHIEVSTIELGLRGPAI
jgi:hypothetical protein